MNRRTRLARSRDQRRKRRYLTWWVGLWDPAAARDLTINWGWDARDAIGPGLIIDSTGVYTRWSGQTEWRDGNGNIAEPAVVTLKPSYVDTKFIPIDGPNGMKVFNVQHGFKLPH
jgi:hypothetical protein